MKARTLLLIGCAALTASVGQSRDKVSLVQLAARGKAGRTKSEHHPAPSPSPPKNGLSPEMITRLQIYLDRQGFGPGKLDGTWGEFCGKALKRYEVSNGAEPTEEINDVTRSKIQSVDPVLVDYEIKPDDSKWVGPLPKTIVGQSRLKALPYPALADFVAERFHLSVGYLGKINPGKDLTKLKAGDQLKVPNVVPFEIEKMMPPDLNAVNDQRVIKVDTKEHLLDLVEGDKVIESFPITPGSKTLPAPLGTWKIAEVNIMPWFRWDKSMLLHGKRSSDYHKLHPGPRNPVGVAWIGINKPGIGIHGTNDPESIGRSASHGCIRLANWDAARLIYQVKPGMTVEIF